MRRVSHCGLSKGATYANFTDVRLCQDTPVPRQVRRPFGVGADRIREIVGHGRFLSRTHAGEPKEKGRVGVWLHTASILSVATRRGSAAESSPGLVVLHLYHTTHKAVSNTLSV